MLLKIHKISNNIQLLNKIVVDICLFFWLAYFKFLVFLITSAKSKKTYNTFSSSLLSVIIFAMYINQSGYNTLNEMMPMNNIINNAD